MTISVYMPIPNHELNDVVFLNEIHINSRIIQHTSERLERSAKHWITLVSESIDDGISAAPLDIVVDCIACLSAAALISKMLFAGSRKKGVVTRCNHLTNLLGSPPIPNIQKLSVRNSWEHLDERLDSITANGLNSYAEIWVYPKQPRTNTVVARHFDPNTLEIKFSQEIFSIRPIAAEAELLIRRVQSAIESKKK
ncbi:hypothetical protein [Delftia sp. UGAL515B_04]|uniref:hypothetical protein n=1 Tax=Delftia sp. UGAL515B_04 TaxID=2986766 RepID=UPI0029547B7B|nr:hypothetical protein [Delftia sp. UGAL515B_04]WON88973.1 hypothetical protein OK021_30360 [Delftia sp. UGAL515B_04]